MRPFSFVTRTAVLTYISSVNEQKFDELPGLFTDDATWWVSGNPAHVAKAGLTTAASHLPALPGLISQFDEYEYKVVNLVSEGCKAIAETQAIGTTSDGIYYNNNITVSFDVSRDGLIKSVREYPEHSEIEWLLEQFAARPKPTPSTGDQDA